MPDSSKMGTTGCGNGRKVFPTVLGIGNRLADQPLNLVKESLQLLDGLHDIAVNIRQIS